MRSGGLRSGQLSAIGITNTVLAAVTGSYAVAGPTAAFRMRPNLQLREPLAVTGNADGLQSPNLAGSAGNLSVAGNAARFPVHAFGRLRGAFSVSRHLRRLLRTKLLVVRGYICRCRECRDVWLRPFCLAAGSFIVTGYAVELYPRFRSMVSASVRHRWLDG